MTLRLLSLDKNGHRYVFRYPPEREDEVATEIRRLAEDVQAKVDWFDAAAMGFQTTHWSANDCLDAL